MERAVIARRNERQRDGRALNAAQFDLGLLSSLSEPLQRLAISPQVKTVVLLELISQPIHDATIPVIAAELGIATGGLHIKHALSDAQHRHIEGAATQVEHQHPLHGAAIEPIGQRSGRRFIENALNADARQATGVPRGLALGIVEVGGHRDHRRLNGLTEIRAGVVNEFAKNAGHQLLGRVFAFSGRTDHPHIALIVGPHGVRHREAAVLKLLPLPADETLEVGEGVARIEHELTPCQLTHQQLSVFAEANH